MEERKVQKRKTGQYNNPQKPKNVSRTGGQRMNSVECYSGQASNTQALMEMNFKKKKE